MALAVSSILDKFADKFDGKEIDLKQYQNLLIQFADGIDDAIIEYEAKHAVIIDCGK